MSARPDEFEGRKLWGLHAGVVVRNDDPLGAGRVKVRIPGLVEPESAWALPLTVGGGSEGRGVWFVPEVGSEVAVLFRGGDPESPHYLGGNWRAPGGASEAPAGGDPNVRAIETARWLILMDDGPGGTLAIVDKVGGHNAFEIDPAAGTVRVRGFARVEIASNGVVDIRGLQVILNGRPVAALPTPIT